VTERYVRKLLESGELKGNRFGRARRIPPEQIDSYIERTSDDQEAA
jgi:excisionase family DNA binding protein